MAVIKHTEFKVICDNCASDITEWFVAKNKTHATRCARAETGLDLVRGRQFCNDCKDEETRPEKFVGLHPAAFDNAVKVDALTLIQ